MPLSRNEVDSLYLICLGRPIENDQIAEGRAQQSVDECARELLCSSEFEILVLKPVLNGQDIHHSVLSEESFSKVKYFAEHSGKSWFSDNVSSYTKWHSFLIDIINHPTIYSNFNIRYEKHSLFVELLKIFQARDKPIIGEIEELNSIRCRGYVMDVRDPSRDLALRLRLNGTTIALIPALDFRRNIQDKHGGTGRVGFEIEFEKLPDFAGLSTGSIDLIEPTSGFELIRGHKVTFSNSSLLEARDGLLNTLHGIRHAVDSLIDQLDGRSAGEIVSLNGYGHARALARRHKPPATKVRIAIIVDARDKPIEESVAEALVTQSSPPISIHVVGVPNCVGFTVTSMFEQSGIPFYVDEAGEGIEAAARSADADWIAMVSSVEQLEPDALAWLAYAAERPETKAVYADSEVENADLLAIPRLTPIFRGALDPDLLFGSNEYDGPLCLIKEMVVEGFDKLEATDVRLALFLRCLERYGRTAFRHVPLVLSRLVRPEAPDVTAARRRNLVQAHLQKIHPGARLIPHEDFVTGPVIGRSQVCWPVNSAVGISVIIPTRDSLDMVISLIASLKEHTAYLSLLQIYVVSHNSSSPQTPQVLEMLRNDEIVTIIEQVGEFNWAALNDSIIRHHNKNDIVLCLNNDMICKTPGWDNLLRGQLARPDVNIVGGRLLYSNGMLQHAGVAMMGVWLHEGLGDAPSHGLYRDRTRVAHECSAVTGAFMAFKQDFYQMIGGFNVEHFPVSYNDVEFCVRAERYGARIIYDPEQVWIHFESETRGFDANDPIKQEKDDRARRRVLKLLSRQDYLDLSVNLHFSRHTRPFSVIAWPQRSAILSWIDQQAIRHADRLKPSIA